VSLSGIDAGAAVVAACMAVLALRVVRARAA
jgi:hypothetical protein